jgi:hypothetical protein
MLCSTFFKYILIMWWALVSTLYIHHIKYLNCPTSSWTYASQWHQFEILMVTSCLGSFLMSAAPNSVYCGVLRHCRHRSDGLILYSLSQSHVVTITYDYFLHSYTLHQARSYNLSLQPFLSRTFELSGLR